MGKLGKYIIVLIVLLVILRLITWFLSFDTFQITEVNVNGNYSITRESIIEKLKELKGKNIFALNSDEIEKKIKSDVRVKDVRVIKKYPDKVEIDIVENQPLAYVKYKNDIYILNEKGQIYGYLNETTKRDMPIFLLENKEDLESYVTILNTIESTDMFKEVSEIKKTDSDFEVLLHSGVRFKTNTTIDEEKYNVAYKLYKNLLEQGKSVEYIDIRFKDFNVK